MPRHDSQCAMLLDFEPQQRISLLCRVFLVERRWDHNLRDDAGSGGWGNHVCHELSQLVSLGEAARRGLSDQPNRSYLDMILHTRAPHDGGMIRKNVHLGDPGDRSAQLARPPTAPFASTQDSEASVVQIEGS